MIRRAQAARLRARAGIAADGLHVEPVDAAGSARCDHARNASRERSAAFLVCARSRVGRLAAAQLPASKGLREVTRRSPAMAADALAQASFHLR